MAFVREDPAQAYRMAIDAARIVKAGLPVVLAVLHDRAGHGAPRPRAGSAPAGHCVVSDPHPCTQSLRAA